MADDINYQLILTKLEEKLKKYRQWNDTVKVRLLNTDIQQLKAYLAHQRTTPPNLSRWIRTEDYRRSALVQGQHEILPGTQTPARAEELVQALEESAVPAEPAVEAAEVEPEIVQAAPDELPIEEPTLAMPSEAVLKKDAEYSGRSDERFQEEIRRIEELKSGNDKELADALAFCENLLGLPDLSSAAHLQLSGLKRDVEEERDRRYAGWMEKGRAARRANDLDGARAGFSAAYSLTHSEEASNALAELNRQVERKGNEAAIRELEYALSIRTDIEKLERAVREAEHLWTIGQLPDRLVEPMRNARQAFSDIRSRIGQIATMASLGDLASVRNAIVWIEDLAFNQKLTTYLHPSSGFVPIEEALREANLRWEDRSREFVADTHAKVEKWLIDRPDQPEIAQSVLLQRLYIDGDPAKPQPIHVSVMDELEIDKRRVDQALVQKRQAQQKVADAGITANPVESYRLLLDARDDFPYLSGLDQRLARGYQQTQDYLLARIKEKSNNAAWEKDHFNFPAARQALYEAQDLIASWPGKDQPEELKTQSQSGTALAAEITADEYKFKEFNVRLDKVKALEAAGRINEALELLEGLLEDEEYSSDERYKQYTSDDLRALNKKLNASKSAAENLELARKAEQELDWEDAHDLTEGLPGQEARELHARAADELDMLEATRLLREAQVAEAKKLLDGLVNRRPELRERLQSVLEKIRLAVEATPALQPFYDQAERDARKKGVTEQAGALRKFRHLGGSKPLYGEHIPPAWPVYQLSLLTAPARKCAAALEEQMRAEFLKGLMDFAAQHQGSQVEPDPQALRVRAEQARALREALLLQTEEERAAARWIELKHGMAEAVAIGSAGAWDKAVEMWEELDLIYPLTPAVQEGLKQALLRMNGHLDQGELAQSVSSVEEPKETESPGEVATVTVDLQPDIEPGPKQVEPPKEEPTSAMPSDAQLKAEAAYSRRANDRFQEEIRRIDELKSGNDEGLNKALGNCDSLLSLEGLTDAARLQLAGLKREVEEERDRRYAGWMEKGRAARKANDLDEARKAFSAAYHLTLSEEASNALAELNRQVELKGNEAAYRSLEAELSIRGNIVRLEAAVRDAESKWINGQLPDQLVEPMRKARQAFNDLRSKMGQLSTALNIGDLTKTKEAVTEIENLKQETYLDPIKGHVPINVAIREANLRWEDRSREFVADTHAKVEKWLIDRPDQPEIAQSILYQCLYIGGDPTKPQPIHDKVVADLEVDKKNVEEKLAQKRQAQQKVSDAWMAANPVEGYGLLLDARDDFPHLSGLEQRLARGWQQALDYLLARIKEKSSNAALEKDNFNFEAARKSLSEAQGLIASWPGKDQPQELRAHSDACAALSGEIIADEHKFGKFNARFVEIKALGADGRINEALELLEGLLEDKKYSSDERYKQYTSDDLRALNKKLNASKSAAEKMVLARKAEQEQDWEEARDLTEGLPGDEARDLYQKAADELDMLEATRLLHEDQVAEAKKLLDGLVNRRPELRERLLAALEKIRLAVEATPALQPFFKQADSDACMKGVTEQAGALRKFRHLGGKPLDGEHIPPAWPAYQLSLLTAPARDRAVALAEQLRAEFLKGLMEFAAQHQGSQGEPDPQTLRVRADQARALREALLLQKEEERAAARWIELKHGMAEAAAIGSAGAWDKAVEMWEELDQIYERTPAVQEGLKRAYIQQALLRMNGHLDQALQRTHTDGDLAKDELDKALAVLQKAQEQPELIDSVEIKFGLALVYERKQDFARAQEVLKTIRSQDAGIKQQVEERAAHLKREAIIHAALCQADELEKQAKAPAKAPGGREAARRKLVRGALEALKKALDAGNGNRSRRLEERFNFLYRGEELHLLQTIDDEIAKNTAEGNLDALLAIVDLEQLEDLKGIPAGKKNARKKLAALKGALENLVKYLGKEAHKLDPNPDNSDFIKDEAAEPLYEKARDAYSKLQIVRGYSRDPLLEGQIAKLSTIVSNLEHLLKLDEDEQGKKDTWQDAVLTDTRKPTEQDAVLEDGRKPTAQDAVLEDGREPTEQDTVLEDGRKPTAQNEVLEDGRKPTEQDKILEYGRNSSAWRNALATNDFTLLERIQRTLEGMQLHQVREVKFFILKLADVKRAAEHLNNGIADIRLEYKQEKFPAVAEKIVELHDLRSMEDASDLRVLNETLYRQLYEWVSPRLYVHTFDNATAEGWENVRQDALKREENWSNWNGWVESLKPYLERASAAKNLADQFDVELPWMNAQGVVDTAAALGTLPANARTWLPGLLALQGESKTLEVVNPAGEKYPAEFVLGDNLPLTYRMWARVAALKHVGIAWLLLEGGPARFAELQGKLERIDAAAKTAAEVCEPNRKNGKVQPDLPEALQAELLQELESYPVLSRKAAEIFNKVLAARGSAREMRTDCLVRLQDVYAQINVRDAYPLPGDFVKFRRAKDMGGFETRLQQARQIGPANPEEAKTYRINKLPPPPPPGLSNWLKKLFWGK